MLVTRAPVLDMMRHNSRKGASKEQEGGNRKEQIKDILVERQIDKRGISRETERDRGERERALREELLALRFC